MDPGSDTDPKAREVQMAIMRAMSPAEKVAHVLELNALILRLQEAEVRRLYPNASDREVFLRVTARRLDADTMRKAYGWAPGDPHEP